MTTYRSFGELSAALKRAAEPRTFRGAIRRPYSRLLTVGRREIQQRLKKVGVTGGIARRRKVKRSDAQLNVRVKRPRVGSGGVITGGFEATGIVAIQETGGKLAPHLIRPRSGRVLRFQGAGGVPTYRRQVLHPGARVRQYPVIRTVVEGLQARLAAAIESSMTEALSKVVG